MNETISNRFWSKVRKTDSCWNWIACKTSDGYGRFSLNGKMVGAHRFSYEFVKGSIPKALQIDHLCRNRACVNPEHMEIVTPRENVLRSPITFASINARKTHCPKDHEFTDENIYPDKSYRQCKTCLKEHAKIYQPLHRKEIRKVQKRFYKKNKMQINKRVKKYRQKHKQLISKQQRKYYQKRILIKRQMP